MPLIPVIASYYGISLVLTDGTAHNLLTLLKAVDTSLSGVLFGCQSLQIQSDDSNGANPVYIGDSHLDYALPRYSMKLLVHEVSLYHWPVSYQVPLAAIYIQCPAATAQAPMQINVEISF